MRHGRNPEAPQVFQLLWPQRWLGTSAAFSFVRGEHSRGRLSGACVSLHVDGCDIFVMERSLAEEVPAADVWAL